jgi:hypothetical protein
MKTCKTYKCENTELVYSGTDAFMLGGIQTETWCYNCANAYNQISRDMEALREQQMHVSVPRELFGVTSD